MWIINFLTSLISLILGIIFINGKGAFLIAGYNTSSKEEKAKYYNMTPLWVGWTLFFIITLFTLIYVNTGNRFRK